MTDRISEIRARHKVAEPEILKMHREMLDICTQNFTDRDAAWFLTWIAEWFNTIKQFWPFEDVSWLLEQIGEQSAKSVEVYEGIYAFKKRLAAVTAERDAERELRREQERKLLARTDEIDALKESQKWIPITEDLPDYGEEVLVIHDGVMDIAAMDEVNVFTNLFTHWMPSPEPPVTKGESK